MHPPGPGFKKRAWSLLPGVLELSVGEPTCPPALRPRCGAQESKVLPVFLAVSLVQGQLKCGKLRPEPSEQSEMGQNFNSGRETMGAQRRGLELGL